MHGQYAQGLGPATPHSINTVDKYDGREDPNLWLNILQQTADLYGWDEDSCLKVAKIKLRGDAQRWGQSRHFNNWNEFRTLLDHRFGETAETAIARLECCRQDKHESPRAFADRFRLNAERSGRIEDAVLVYQFTQRLQPSIRTEVVRKQLHSIDRIVEYAEYWLQAQGAFQIAPDNYAENNSSNSTGGTPAPEQLPYNNSAPKRNTYERTRFQPGMPINRPPFRDMSNRSSRPNYHAAAAKQVPVTPAASAAVDDLTRRMQQLELNLQHQEPPQSLNLCLPAHSQRQAQQPPTAATAQSQHQRQEH